MRLDKIRSDHIRLDQMRSDDIQWNKMTSDEIRYNQMQSYEIRSDKMWDDEIESHDNSLYAMALEHETETGNINIVKNHSCWKPFGVPVNEEFCYFYTTL